MAKKIRIIPKDIVCPEAIILDDSEKWMGELYQEVFAKTAEEYGENSLAYRNITNGINKKNVTGSQFLWNTNLGKYLPENQKVIRLEDMEEIYDLDESFFRGFYTDSPEVVLRTNEATYNKNQLIINYLERQLMNAGEDFSPENPIVISNPKLVKDSHNPEKEYGLKLKLGQDTKMQNDSRFAYSNKGNEIQFGEKQKIAGTKESGLSRVCLDGFGNLYSRDGYLAFSDDGGRVILVNKI